MKYRFNEEKFLKNFAIFSTGLTIGNANLQNSNLWE